ncbi:MAG TPA: CooT family nickel-binding protein [Bacillota bacterium]|nr:CooT family nickel-binding protein [Bacillota bacterium]
MCEANVYLIDEKGDKILLLEAVDKLIPQEDGIFLENIFGQRKKVKAKIKEMALVEHDITLEKT